MRDAARDGRAAQVLEQVVGRAPHVQDHRQIELARQRELRGIEVRLALAVQTGHEVIEPDLADRDEARVVAQCAASASRSRARSASAARSTNSGWMPSAYANAVRMGEPTHARRSSPPSTAGSTICVTPRARARGNDGVAVGVELGRVEMTVGVDPVHGLHRASNCECGMGGAE